MPGNPNWANVVLALHCNGTDGSTVITEATGKTLTAQNGAQIRTDQSVFGGASLFFDGSSGVALPASSSLDLPDAWTFKCRIRFGTLTGKQQILTGNSPATNCQIYCDSAGKIGVYGPGGNALTSVSCGFVVGTWYALAVVHSGTSLYVYVNGSRVGSVLTYNGSITFSSGGLGAFYIGGNPSHESFLGYLDEIQLTKGIAEHTGDSYTVETAPFDFFALVLTYVSGTVLGVTGTPVARTVRAYSHSTGELQSSGVSDGTTGAYSLAVAGQCYVVVLPDTSALNPLVQGWLTPE